MEGWVHVLKCIATDPEPFVTSLLKPNESNLQPCERPDFGKQEIKIQSTNVQGNIEYTLAAQLELQDNEDSPQEAAKLVSVEIDDDDDDDVIEIESIQEEVAVVQNQKVTQIAPIDLEPPTCLAASHVPDKRGRLLIYTEDIAKSFLFHYQKHHLKWSFGESAAFSSTSRRVERMFSLSKFMLDRNKLTRVEIVSALVCLHDHKPHELAQLWKKHHNEDTRSQATQVIKSVPKSSDIDEFYLSGIIQEVREEKRKKMKKESKQMIKDMLLVTGIIKEDENVRKQHMLQYLEAHSIKLPKNTTVSQVEQTILSQKNLFLNE